MKLFILKLVWSKPPAWTLCFTPLIGSPHDAKMLSPNVGPITAAKVEGDRHPPLPLPTASVDGIDAPEDHAPATPNENEPCAPNRGTLGTVRQEGVNRFVLMKTNSGIWNFLF